MIPIKTYCGTLELLVELAKGSIEEQIGRNASNK